jgi:hypothetical protein
MCWRPSLLEGEKMMTRPMYFPAAEQGSGKPWGQVEEAGVEIHVETWVGDEQMRII